MWSTWGALTDSLLRYFTENGQRLIQRRRFSYFFWLVYMSRLLRNSNTSSLFLVTLTRTCSVMIEASSLSVSSWSVSLSDDSELYRPALQPAMFSHLRQPHSSSQAVPAFTQPHWLVAHLVFLQLHTIFQLKKFHEIKNEKI